MKVNAAFIFVAPEVDYKTARAVIDTPVVNLTVVGVKNYTEGVEVAKELAGNFMSGDDLFNNYN